MIVCSDADVPVHFFPKRTVLNCFHDCVYSLVVLMCLSVSSSTDRTWLQVSVEFWWPWLSMLFYLSVLFLADGTLTWVYKGSVLEVVSTSTGQRVACLNVEHWLRDAVANIVCVREFHCQGCTRLLVAVNRSTEQGMVVLLDVPTSLVVRVIETPQQVSGCCCWCWKTHTANYSFECTEWAPLELLQRQVKDGTYIVSFVLCKDQFWVCLHLWLLVPNDLKCFPALKTFTSRFHMLEWLALCENTRSDILQINHSFGKSVSGFTSDGCIGAGLLCFLALFWSISLCQFVFYCHVIF